MAYLDYNSTTPMDKRVVDEMMPTFTKYFGNPSSTHDSGMAALELVDKARKDVASIVGCNASDVIFTSGATEANNMAISGLGLDSRNNRRVLYGATEHKSVIQTCVHLGEKSGLEALPIPVLKNGIIDLDALHNSLASSADIVCIMAANSETGIINPIEKISSLVHDYDAILLCDATQAIGKIPFDAESLGVDVVTLSSHKIYGPKGCGAIVASRDIRKQMSAMIHGGGQERNMRSGTQNVPGIVGFGKACQIAQTEGMADAPRQAKLRDDFEDKMTQSVSNITIHGKNVPRLPNTSSMRIAGALADAVIINAPEVEISTGSACSSAAIEPSHVLTAMGLDTAGANESLRVSIGRHTTQDDMDVAVQSLIRAVTYVREKNNPGERLKC